MRDDQNPKQGCFQVVRLRANGKEIVLAANIPNAKPLPFSLPTDDEKLHELADYFVDAYGDALRQAFLNALEQFSILVYLRQTDEVAPANFAPLDDTDANLIAQLFATNPSEPKSLSEIIDHLRFNGRLTELTDEQAAFAVKELLERNGYVLVGESEWLSPDRADTVDRVLQRRPPAPVVRDDDEYYETVELPPEGQSLADEIGEVEEEPEEFSLDEWRERARTEPIKLPPLTFQNIVEAYFPLNRRLSEFLPPGRLRRVYLRFRAVNESEPMVFWVSRGERSKRGLKADEAYKDRFRQWLISVGIPAGTTFWIERISDFEYRVYAKPLEPPRTVRQVKFVSFENGELKFELENVEQRWEGDPLIFKAELRFEDLEALREEARKVRLKIATIVRQVFEKLDPNGQGLHWSEVFNATYLVRMCSPRTVLGILYKQPCFESLGDGRYRLNPKVPLQIVRHQRVHHPAIELVEVPPIIWASRGFVMKVRTRYCQQVALERSQDSENWETVQTLDADPNGQKTRRFRLSLPEGHWWLRATATAVNGQTLTTEPLRVQVHSAPVAESVSPVKPPEPQPVIVTLPFGLECVLFSIPFAPEPLSESIVRQLEQLTRGRYLPPIHPSGQIQLMEGEQPRLSLTAEQLDEELQQLVATGGNYVTHRTVADFMVNLAQPKPKEKVADICCGSGIFLVKAWRFVQQVYGDDAEIELFGADIRAIACQATKLNLQANGFNDGTVIHEMNSLTAQLPEGECDLVFGNPPFDLTTVTGFLRRWVALLKEGGRMVVLVPAGVLTGSQQRWIREQLVESGTILAVIALPRLGGIYGAAGNVLYWCKELAPADHQSLLVTVSSATDLEGELRGILQALQKEG